MRISSFHIFLFVAFTSLLHACKNDLQAVRDLTREPKAQVEEVYDFEMLYSDSAIVRIRISGPVMLRHVDQQAPLQEFPEGVLVEFFDPAGNVTSKLSSRYAVRDEDEKKVLVRDSVVWESVNQEKLETSELTWDEREEKIFTNKFVTIRRPDEIIYGHGFESNQEFTRSRIRAIEGRIKMNELNSAGF
ncbi:MAG: LPS export ABC transporter periplasmic protein LptC [Bacteroidetes bacterium]|nr:LPS export ABC transporter periplasmic protein LptC [Bacteroidota bacterium]